MARQVDIFIPMASTPQLVKSRKSSESADITSAAFVPAARNDVIAPSRKSQPLDHLRPRYPRPAAQVAASLSAPRKRPVDVPIRPSQPAIRPQPAPIAIEKPKKTRRHKYGTIKLLLAGAAMLAIGTLLQAAAYGEMLIGAYAVFALIRRVESRTTFMLALTSMGCILVMLLLRPDFALMQNFAIYAFLLLLVGTVSLTTETRY